MSDPETITETELAEALKAYSALGMSPAGFAKALFRDVRIAAEATADPDPDTDPPEASSTADVSARERPGQVPGERSDGSDEERPAEPHMDLLDAAWGVIANAGWDDCAKTTGWQEAAVRWRDDYHRWLDLHLRPGGYQTWEQLAVGVTRERDALFAEAAELRRTIRAISDAKYSSEEEADDAR